MKQWGGDLNYRPEKKASKKKRSDVEASQKKPKDERDYRVGRTIAGATNNARQRNLEHIAARKKQQRKNTIIVLLILAAIIACSILIGQYVNEKIAEREAKIIENNPTEPTVAIIDENAGNNISARVKVFVARLEADAAEKNVAVDHVVLPFQKAREMLVYFVGRKEYYKMTIERGSTVQVEDAERMMRYLDSKELAPEYVDIRVEGKAYYK